MATQSKMNANFYWDAEKRFSGNSASLSLRITLRREPRSYECHES